MQILDVISSVSRSSKWNDLTGGAYSAPQTPWLSLRNLLLKALLLKGGQEREARGSAKVPYAPGARNPHAATAYICMCGINFLF